MCRRRDESRATSASDGIATVVENKEHEGVIEKDRERIREYGLSIWVYLEILVVRSGTRLTLQLFESFRI